MNPIPGSQSHPMPDPKSHTTPEETEKKTRLVVPEHTVGNINREYVLIFAAAR
jgi:hypothetical protein